MFVLGSFVHGLARMLEGCSNACRRLANFLNGFLPALLPPARLDSRVRAYYGSFYELIRPEDPIDLDGRLEWWEEKAGALLLSSLASKHLEHTGRNHRSLGDARQSGALSP